MQCACAIVICGLSVSTELFFFRFSHKPYDFRGRGGAGIVESKIVCVPIFFTTLVSIVLHTKNTARCDHKCIHSRSPCKEHVFRVRF